MTESVQCKACAPGNQPVRLFLDCHRVMEALRFTGIEKCDMIAGQVRHSVEYPDLRRMFTALCSIVCDQMKLAVRETMSPAASIAPSREGAWT